jgi:hypothetical protein
MTATVVTISARVNVRELERLARARVDRDGVAPLAAPTASRRQVQQLHHLKHRLSGDDSLDCYSAEHGDAAHLTVFLRSGRGSRRGVGWFGEARTG